MGTKIFELLKQYMPSKTTGVFVEIGSDRYEGSTEELANLAKCCGTKLISVDISDDAQKRLQHSVDNVEFVTQTGSKWAQEFACSQNTVALLYLDNFDYIYDVKDIRTQDITKQQIADYASRDIVMNNVNCQVEHMKQLLTLYSMFHNDTIIMFDDTYQINDCWVGKCGPCVIYLLCQGYEILEWTTDSGVIMKRKP
jgi:hypothetical protein